MSILSSDFQASKPITVPLHVPSLAMQILQRVSHIAASKEICIAGGFVRGLYLQQILGLSPQMNDVDIFADISSERFHAVEPLLETEFGVPVRVHVGQFEKEDFPRGLIEFSLPAPLRKICAGVESIQLNFGAAHPWSNPFKYIAEANLGINQIAICHDGTVIASDACINDLENKTMTMNSNRQWSTYDWARTVKSVERMLAEREEFKNWKSVLVQKPHTATTGRFWEDQKITFLEPVR